MSELEFIRWLRERVGGDPRVPVGPGDDAAVVRLAGGRDAVVTTDMMIEGVHFELMGQGRTSRPNHPTTARLVGRKALAINLSDLAAMAAEPVAAFVSVALPRPPQPPPRAGGEEGDKLARELFEGIQELADAFGVVVAGGDTNGTDGPLVVNVTLVGQTTERGPVLRSGARPGDAILVSGRLGGSLAGRHLTFEPRVREALQLHARYALHAMIDLSDGLATDLRHILEESGCGAVLDPNRIPISDAAKEAAAQGGPSALARALGDGEDFELCFTLSEADARRLLAEQPLGEVRLSQVGRIVAGAGLWWEDEDGGRKPIDVAGYEHAID